MIIALCSVAITTLVLVSYMGLVRANDCSVIRSQGWNAAMTLAEAGAEEAMAHLNSGAGRSGDGWGNSGAFFGPVSRTLFRGSYSVVVDSNNITPTIYSTGYVTLPTISATLSRVVQVTGSNLPLFNVAFGAKSSITMNGSGLAADSFNSAKTNLSTNGQYDSSKTSTNGNVASMLGPVNLGNHTIAGNLYLGTGAQYNSGAGQVSGKIYNDFNVQFPDVALPPTTFLPAPFVPAIIGGIIYNHAFLVSGSYYTTDSGSVYVAPGVTVTLRVDSSSFSPGNIFIDAISGVSGTLMVYQVSGSSSLTGNTTVQSGKAQNFFYFGLPGVTSITYGGNSSFVGAIYAPEADLTLNGGGNNNGLIGSSVTKSITMNGHYNFHFDEALLSIGPSRGYLATSWSEL